MSSGRTAPDWIRDVMKNYSHYSRRDFFRWVVCTFAVVTWLLLWPRHHIRSRYLLENKKSLVIYSGPTSLDEKNGKTSMYLKNFQYFLEHGVSCSSPHVHVDFILVLTEDVATQYSSPNGLVTKKRQNCKKKFQLERAQHHNHGVYESSIQIIIRENRCVDMESMRIVTEQKGIERLRNEYDNVVFLNCGMVGPKVGPMSPIPIHFHWTQLFTSLLTDSVRMSGLTINPCFNKKCRAPHVQSFLYAISIDTLHILISAGSIFDCDESSKASVIRRYEVGMSEILLNRGFSIAVPFMNNWELGKALTLDKRNFTDMKPAVNMIMSGDLFREGNMRSATSTMDKSQLKLLLGGDPEDHKLDILPWEYYVFFKVSRFVPHDIQLEMQYDEDMLREEGVSIVPN